MTLRMQHGGFEVGRGTGGRGTIFVFFIQWEHDRFGKYDPVENTFGSMIFPEHESMIFLKNGIMIFSEMGDRSYTWSMIALKRMISIYVLNSFDTWSKISKPT